MRITAAAACRMELAIASCPIRKRVSLTRDDANRIFTFVADLDGYVSVFDHAFRAVSKSRNQSRISERLRPKTGYTSPGLLVAGASHGHRSIHLLAKKAVFPGYAVANRLKLKTDSGKALGQRVVDLMRQAFAFVSDSAQAPVFCKKDKMIEGEE